MGQELRTLLRQVIEERGFSLADAGRRLGKSRSFLPKALDPENTTSLRADQIGEILATIGKPEAQFYRRYLLLLEGNESVIAETDPHAVLSALCPDELDGVFRWHAAGEKLLAALANPRRKGAELTRLSRSFAALAGR